MGDPYNLEHQKRLVDRVNDSIVTYAYTIGLLRTSQFDCAVWHWAIC